MCLCAGLLESSMRLKPHEAQSYRKKALWVSWISIVVTLILAVAAFSKYQNYSSTGSVCQMRPAVFFVAFELMRLIVVCFSLPCWLRGDAEI